ncbi:MAG TPA: DUF5695 domain-containing protein [Sphingomonas sp.]|nr:DUF5695 domain-containing protein [Sphingomonas sp.]
MTKTRLSFAALLLAGLPLAGSLHEAAWSQEKPTKVYPPIAETAKTAPAFDLTLRTDTQTLARLSPKGDPNFSFVPSNREAERAGDGYVHLGDLNIRLRTPGGDWRDFASSHERKPIAPIAADGALTAADITATMGDGFPLHAERRWIADGDALVLRFTLANPGDQPIEIGGLGMPMVFDNIIQDRSLEQAHEQASFVDPYIGRDAGYLQVTRLNGKGPALLVLPEPGTPLEAYRPIRQEREGRDANIFTDKSSRNQTAEGFYDWTVASKGFAEKEWKDAAGRQWNAPTSITLAPGASRSFGVRLVQSPSIPAIEKTLIAHDRPVAVGVPGYVVPTDLDASLFLKAPQKVARIESFPAGALTATPARAVNGWTRYTVRSKGFGPARLTITYADGSAQTVSYYITKPLELTVADLGHFTTTKQWFDDKTDPFHRAPAILSYDHETGKILTQEERVWIAGMSDEGGAGSWVAAMIKQLDNPDPAEVAKLDRLVDETVVGKLQIAAGAHAGAVKKSLFYYDPKAFPGYYDKDANWKTWTAWDKKGADDLGRSFNYPHVAIGHWVLYRLARDHQGLVTRHPWRWYLEHGYQTIVAMMRDASYYTQFGQMEGQVFIEILDALKAEGMTAEAANLEKLMKGRADHWSTLAYPFGSEMAWDSTGQPEVYAWMRYFGFDKQADQTRDVILGYDPTIPSWGYNGNARRYWDFLYAGKYPRIERQIHHYGSTNNAIPLFDSYRADPEGHLYWLRVAYGGLMGGITNIGEDGFGSAAFHSWPDMMRWDPYTGDYGMGFYGHAYTSATYVVNDPTFGWLSFGGNLVKSGGTIHVTPKDSARTRLFFQPATLWLTLDAGKFEAADYDSVSGAVTVRLAAADAHTKRALLHVEQTAGGKAYAVKGFEKVRGAYAIPLGKAPQTIAIRPVG